MTDKPAPSPNEAALLEVVKAARVVLTSLERGSPKGAILEANRSVLRTALANLDRLAP